MRKPTLRRLLPRAATIALVIGLLAGLSELVEGGPARTRAAGAAPTARPNILVLETDDQTVESMRVMTNVRDLLARQGASFTNSFASDPQCCSSRATLLTGQYAHDHGMSTGSEPAGEYTSLDQSNALPVWLQRAGYDTAFVGKYLNGYGTGASATAIPPGWSEWHASIDPSSYRYWNYTLNENGRLVTYGSDTASYQTDVYARKAAELVRRLAPPEQPFFLWVSFLAPHGDRPDGAMSSGGPALPDPAPRHRDRFAFEPLPEPPSFNERDTSDKPPGVRNRPLLTPARIAAIHEGYGRRLESLLAVDEAVGSIVEALRATGELDNTLILFTSDNGFMQGEHRIAAGKAVPYEPSVRVPLVMRGPGVPHNRSVDDLVSNIDLAPTILDAAGARPDRVLDGTSLLPLARDPLVELGRDLLLETTGYTGLRTPRYKYVEYQTGDRELYDLAVDPYEVSNRARAGAYGAVRAELSRRLAALRLCAGPACRRGPRLELQLTAGGRARLRGCASSAVKATVGGQDVRVVGQVVFYLGSNRMVLDEKPPFGTMLAPSALEGGVKLRARVALSDGRRVTLGKTVRACP